MNLKVPMSANLFTLSLLISLTLILPGCFNKKGLSMIENIKETEADHLYPTAIYPGKNWWSWAQINTVGTFACNGRQGYGFATVDSEFKISYKPVKRGFPGVNTSLYATEDGRILWGKEGYRGLWAIDVESQKTIDGIVFVNDGSSEIKRGWGIDSTSPYLMVSSSFPRRDYSKTSKTFVGIDITKNEYLFRREDYGNPCDKNAQDYLFMIPFKNGSFLGEHGYPTDTVTKLDWHLVEVSDTGFSEPINNPLVVEMSKKNFSLSLWSQEIKRWDIPKRYILGYVAAPKDFDGPRDIPTVVRWDEEMEDIQISPLLFNFPAAYEYTGAWAVSPDGEWARCGVIKKFDYSIDYNCFFHLDEKYPFGVSPGVIGASSRGLGGIFVEHDEHGTLYLDRSNDYPNAVAVYQMSDFFESLLAAGKKKTGL